MAVPELTPMNILAWTSEEYRGERYMGPIAKLRLPELKAKVRGKVRCEILHSQCLGVALNSMNINTFSRGMLGWMAPWFTVIGISKLEVPTNLAWFQFLMDLRFLEDGRRSRWLLFSPTHAHKNTHSSKGVKLGKLPLKALRRQRKTHDSPQTHEPWPNG